MNDFSGSWEGNCWSCCLQAERMWSSYKMLLIASTSWDFCKDVIKLHIHWKAYLKDLPVYSEARVTEREEHICMERHERERA